jgi:hypothetical protein
MVNILSIFIISNLPMYEISGPWEKIQPQLVKQSFPCEPCKVPVTISCHGNHTKRTQPCSQVAAFSCKSPCEWQLPCGNHKCRLPCHVRQISPQDSKVRILAGQVE